MRILSLILILTSTIAFAGKEGGSGGAYVCRDPNTKAVTKVELVDLWEAREISGLTIVYDDDTSVEDQVQAAIKRIGKIAPRYGRILAGYQLKPKTTGPDVVWTAPDDVNSKFTKAGCLLEGMMYYNDITGVLSLNPELFPHQRKTETAASYFHEIVYKFLRGGGATDSRYARHLTGCIFSSDPASCFEISPPSLPEKEKVWSCNVPKSKDKPASYEDSRAFESFSFYVFGKTGPMEADTTPELSYYVTNFDGTDVSKSSIYTTGQSFGLKTGTHGAYEAGYLSISLYIAGIAGRLQLGNPIYNFGPPQSVVFHVTSYNPLTFYRRDEPKQIVRCRLVSEEEKKKIAEGKN